MVDVSLHGCFGISLVLFVLSIVLITIKSIMSLMWLLEFCNLWICKGFI